MRFSQRWFYLLIYNAVLTTWRYIQYIRYEVFTPVTMKNAVFWAVPLCTSCVNRSFGGTYHLHLQGRKIHERGTSVSCTKSQNSAFFKTLQVCNVVLQHPVARHLLLLLIHRLTCKNRKNKKKTPWP
jgi:hypothetical protein